MEQLTKNQQKVLDLLTEKATEVSISQPIEITDFSVNCCSGQNWGRYTYSTFSDALESMINAGEGFNIGISCKGGSSQGNRTSTSDFAIILSEHDMLEFLLGEGV